MNNRFGEPTLTAEDIERSIVTVDVSHRVRGGWTQHKIKMTVAGARTFRRETAHLNFDTCKIGESKYYAVSGTLTQILAVQADR